MGTYSATAAHAALALTSPGPHLVRQVRHEQRPHRRQRHHGSAPDAAQQRRRQQPPAKLATQHLRNAGKHVTDRVYP